MNLQNILDQFTGTGGQVRTPQRTSGDGDLERLASNIPGGLAGGAAAGGIMALLVGSKSARKFAGKAAVYGGAAVLGGVAFNAFRNWQSEKGQASMAYRGAENEQQANVSAQQAMTGDFQLSLIKAMIAAANADGHIDSDEQQRIFSAVEQMQLNAETKGLIFDLLRQPISVAEIVEGVHTIEQKSELYLASCLAINPDHESEQRHLDALAQALDLPAGLPAQLGWQARQALTG